ncbi:MAG TPA: hypothetical protein VE978_16495 [Chitinophagales bacterium]|nr:hypothetical protein [Chitinophagales bacterium]
MKLRTIFFILFILVSNLLFSQNNYCIQNRFAPAYYFDSSQIKIDSNIVYGWAERWPSTIVDTLKMDLFYPDESIDPLNKRPFILFIHGGSFLAGDRHDMDYLCMEMTRRGFCNCHHQLPPGLGLPGNGWVQYLSSMFRTE